MKQAWFCIFNRSALTFLFVLAASFSGLNLEARWGAPDLNHEVSVISRRIIRVRYVNLVLQRPEREARPSSFFISSEDDPQFTQPRIPADGACLQLPLRYSMRDGLSHKATVFHLVLDRDLSPGKTYRLTSPDLEFIALDAETGRRLHNQKSSAPELSFTWLGDRQQSPAIHVNQVGYLPDMRKFAYLSVWAGMQMQKRRGIDLDFSGFRRFSLLDDESGEIVFRGSVKAVEVERGGRRQRRAVPDKLSQSRVWEMDFSDFKESGRYCIQIPGLGSSVPFNISSKVYNQVFGVLCRGLYQQRCGLDLKAEFTRHYRPACHLNDAVVPAISNYAVEGIKFFPQNPGLHPCAGGSHDGGTYGKYTLNSALFCNSILQALEVMPDKLAFRASPIPESADEIPDLLQLAARETAWLSRMQDPKDGAFFLGVDPSFRGRHEGLLPSAGNAKSTDSRTLLWKDSAATAAAAAALAQAGRNREFRKYWPEAASGYLRQAEKAWKFCQGQGLPAYDRKVQLYGRHLGALDEYCWLAVELWLATGQKEYHDYFLKNHVPADSWRWGWWPLFGAGGAATRAYSFAADSETEEKMHESCRKALVQAARETSQWQGNWAFRCSFAPKPFEYNRWAWYFLSDIASYDLLLAAALTDDEEQAAEFRQAAGFNADYEMGNHPGKIAAISGIGSFRPLEIFHYQSRSDSIFEPVPGIPAGFQPSSIPQNPEHPHILSHNYGALPVVYRQIDAWIPEQECRLPAFGKTLMTYAMLADAEEQLPGVPDLAISGNGRPESVSGTAPLTVLFKGAAAAENGKQIRDWFWDLDCGDFAVDPEFSYTFTEPGVYRVCASITDDDGWLGYRYLTVKVAQPEAELPNGGMPFSADAGTVALWHFDQHLEDELSQRSAELLGNAGLTKENRLWMKAPRGTSVCLTAEMDALTVESPLPLLGKKNPGDWTIEAFVQVRAKVSSGHGKIPIFVLENNGIGAVIGLEYIPLEGISPIGIASVSDSDRRKLARLFGVRPGWHHWSLSWDEKAGKIIFRAGEDRCEFSIPPGSLPEVTRVRFGGFVGWIDEVRIKVSDSGVK